MPMESGKRSFRFKMILFGKESVGKTSLVDRYVKNKFETDYISTLGYNVFEKVIEFDNKSITLMIYDIGGQEKFRDLRRRYAEGADTAFIVYDITNRESFDMLLDWKKDLVEFTEDVAFIIIGNKNDLKDMSKVSSEEGEKISSKLGALGFLETSAKSGKGVNEAFEQLVIKTINNRFKE